MSEEIKTDRQKLIDEIINSIDKLCVAIKILNVKNFQDFMKSLKWYNNPKITQGMLDLAEAYLNGEKTKKDIVTYYTELQNTDEELKEVRNKWAWGLQDFLENKFLTDVSTKMKQYEESLEKLLSRDVAKKQMAHIKFHSMEYYKQKLLNENVINNNKHLIEELEAYKEAVGQNKKITSKVRQIIRNKEFKRRQYEQSEFKLKQLLNGHIDAKTTKNNKKDKRQNIEELKCIPKYLPNINDITTYFCKYRNNLYMLYDDYNKSNKEYIKIPITKSNELDTNNMSIVGKDLKTYKPWDTKNKLIRQPFNKLSYKNILIKTRNNKIIFLDDLRRAYDKTKGQ